MLRIALIGEVNYDMYKELYNRTRNLQSKPLEITLCTEGGDFYVALGMYRYIRSLPVEVTVIASGQCFSSGMIILQAGDIRLAESNAHLMIHFGDTSVSGLNDMRQEVRTTDQHFEILCKRSKLKKEEKQLLFNQENYFTPKKALLKGLVDGIKDEQEET